MNTTDRTKKTTHFGFSDVPVHEKQTRVENVFRSVADKYDLMNDLMSLGLHRLWKQAAINACQIRPGQVILDLAAGTGDLTRALSKMIKAKGLIVSLDINEKMLQHGRDRLLDQGILHPIHFIEADAEALPFQSNTFDRIIIAFGLRNVTHKEAALRSMYRVLKPGGHCVILEFSKPILKPLNSLYDFYSFNVIPKLGDWIANDKASYQYLVESIRMHPDQAALKTMMEESGFEDVNFTNLNLGIVAIHKGFKY